MGCNECPRTNAQPPDRQPLRRFSRDDEANGSVWGIILVMWVLSLIGVLLDLFTKVDLHGLGFVAWIVFLGGIALVFFIGFRGS